MFWTDPSKKIPRFPSGTPDNYIILVLSRKFLGCYDHNTQRRVRKHGKTRRIRRSSARKTLPAAGGRVSGGSAHIDKRVGGEAKIPHAPLAAHVCASFTAPYTRKHFPAGHQPVARGLPHRRHAHGSAVNGRTDFGRGGRTKVCSERRVVAL